MSTIEILAKMKGSDSIACPICKSESLYSFKSRWGYSIHKCTDTNNCGHLCLADFHPDVGLMNTQDNPALISQLAADNFKTYEKRNNHLIQFWIKRGFLKTGVRLFDYGSGTGHILKSLKNRIENISIQCLEASHPLRQHLKSNNFDAISSLEQTSGTFDAILIIEVLEHLSDPISVLQKLGSCLTPRGKIFISTPCGELRNCSRATNAYNAKEHIHFFTEKSLNLACQMAGLRKINYEIVKELYPPAPLLSIRRIKDLVGTVKSFLLGPDPNPSIGFEHLVGFTSRIESGDSN